jgi:hypothetical protein
MGATPERREEVEMTVEIQALVSAAKRLAAGYSGEFKEDAIQEMLVAALSAKTQTPAGMAHAMISARDRMYRPHPTTIYPDRMDCDDDEGDMWEALNLAVGEATTPQGELAIDELFEMARTVIKYGKFLSRKGFTHGVRVYDGEQATRWERLRVKMLMELVEHPRQRHVDKGGNPRLSPMWDIVCSPNVYPTDEEIQHAARLRLDLDNMLADNGAHLEVLDETAQEEHALSSLVEDAQADFGPAWMEKPAPEPIFSYHSIDKNAWWRIRNAFLYNGGIRFHKTVHEEIGAHTEADLAKAASLISDFIISKVGGDYADIVEKVLPAVGLERLLNTYDDVEYGEGSAFSDFTGDGDLMRIVWPDDDDTDPVGEIDWPGEPDFGPILALETTTGDRAWQTRTFKQAKLEAILANQSEDGSQLAAWNAVNKIRWAACPEAISEFDRVMRRALEEASKAKNPADAMAKVARFEKNTLEHDFFKKLVTIASSGANGFKRRQDAFSACLSIANSKAGRLAAGIPKYSIAEYNTCGCTLFNGSHTCFVMWDELPLFDRQLVPGQKLKVAMEAPIYLASLVKIEAQ